MEGKACSTYVTVHLQKDTKVTRAEAERRGSRWVCLKFNGHPGTDITIFHEQGHYPMLVQAFEKIARELRLHAPPEPVYFPRLHPVCATVGYRPPNDVLACLSYYRGGFTAGEQWGRQRAHETVAEWYTPEPPDRC